MASGVRVSGFEDDTQPPITTMILADLVELPIIDRSERKETKIPKSPRPAPRLNAGLETTVTYTALNVCNKQPFKDLFLAKKGKNIKLSFEGYTYYGYISNPIYTDYDIQFDFTYVSRFQQLAEDSFPGYYTL